MYATSRSVRTLLTALLVALLALAVSAAFGAGEARAGSGSTPGSILWKHTPNPTPHGDGLWLCAPAPGGGVYVCGTTGWIQEDLTSMDIWVVRYQANGTMAWSRTWDGPDRRSDDAGGMVVDRAGNVYVAGSTVRAAGSRDSVVLKYSPGGALKWATVYAASAQEDEARSIGLDAAGKVYVGGELLTGSNWNAYVARFDGATGVRDWTAVYDSGGYDVGWRLAVTKAGDSYLVGQTATAPTGYDALLVKVTAAGGVDWARSYAGTNADSDAWETVDLARGGGVLVAGELDGTGDVSIVGVARYTSVGDRKWLGSWTMPPTIFMTVTAAAPTGSGGIWVAGYMRSAAGNYRGFVGKWNSAGSGGSGRVAGSAKHQVRYEGLVLDRAGNVYVTGTAKASASGWNLLAAKYSPGCMPRWRTTASFGGKHDDELDQAVLGPSGTIYSCGLVREDTANSRAVVVRIRR
ncbi:MAG TPA: hypothetical protein VMH50_12670 [Thermoleophilia bacterium]|nr:hypothetical protein [Thermoleophilia bacterium]